jgi:hypothetical protein
MNGHPLRSGHSIAEDGLNVPSGRWNERPTHRGCDLHPLLIAEYTAMIEIWAG